MSEPAVPPNTGSFPLSAIARWIHASASQLRLVGTCTVRSVLVQRQDGRWVNHCTSLRIDTAADGDAVNQLDDRIAGPARLIGCRLSVESIASSDDLVSALTTWRVALPDGGKQSPLYGPGVQERFWEFQDTANLYHHPSGGELEEHPFWVIDPYDKITTNRSFATPQGPFRHPSSKLFAGDMKTLVRKWCQDGARHESSSVMDSYSIIIPDNRAYIGRIARVGPSLEIRLKGGKKDEPIKCVLTAFDAKGGDRTSEAESKRGVIRVRPPGGTKSFEVYLFDEIKETEIWCDHSARIELANVTPRGGREEPATAPQAPREPARPASAPKPKTFVIDKWEVLEQLGEGGQALTYKVRSKDDPSSDPCVLKRLKNPERLERFRQEVAAALKLVHPNIISVYSSQLEAKPYYFIAEYCAPGSLDKASPFWRDDPVAALLMFGQICDGVAYAHASGVVHRDLKPANILLRGLNGPPVVADFGICYLLGPEDARLTETAEAVGPRLYMAPELEDGRLKAVTPSVDSYSLGKILYWLVSGGKIFSREKHRVVEWDLKGKTDETLEGWRNVFLEHVNNILDLAVVDDPALRRSASNLGVLARKAAKLILERRLPLAPHLKHPCTYCGLGYYAVRASDTHQVSNFGFSPVGDANWRIFACTNCGHVQAFRVDLASRKEAWGDGS